MLLLAVSGGPDSMFLLNEYRNKKIIVAHVNYNKRDDSHIDQKIVEDFCKLYNIKLEIKNIKTQPKKNFQDWAREKRYLFFKEIYDKYGCTQLLVSHHKDDFLETAIMQQRTNRLPNFFGIKKKIFLYHMNIYRPYINLYWKKQIIEINKKNKIKYAIDYTNELPIYARNKIRIELLEKPTKEKQSIYKWFKMSNKILSKKNKKLDCIFLKWQKKNFQLDYWKHQIYKEEILFKFIHKDNLKIKLSKEKLKNIVIFLQANTQNKKYKLSNKYMLIKYQDKIIISTISNN